ncbi:MAG: thymidylate synthase, flavin-dependent [Clostridiales bacterium GWE2_32_10]|nr:MAG: thymidylate synthase, flavin-dependent [Clostridiales bacterium GWE2_32_10]
MKITILNKAEGMEKIAAAAAKLSTTDGTAEGIYNNIDLDKDSKLIQKVIKIRHVTLIEHIYFNLALEGISVFIEQFLIEHRLCAFTVKSRRYVDYRNQGTYIPDFEFDKKVSDKTRQYVNEAYKNHVNYLFENYAKLIDNGMKVEDARFILPYSFYSDMFMSSNARELTHLIYACIYGRGRHYSEIRNFGEMLHSKLKELAPNIFDNIRLIEEGEEISEEKLNVILNNKVQKRRDKKDNEDKVEIVDFTKNPEELVAISAIIKNQQCAYYDAKSLLESDESLQNKILEIVCTDKRKRELEQINFTIRINNVSLPILTHISRHRIQALIVPSFTEFGKSKKNKIPAIVEENETLKRIFYKVLDTHNNLYDEFVKLGASKYSLVYMYLSGNLIDIQTTMNAREVFNFLKVRACERAQWEIKEYSREMLAKLKKIAPNIFKYAGPSCVATGRCTEGVMSCGRQDEVREAIGKL